MADLQGRKVPVDHSDWPTSLQPTTVAEIAGATVWRFPISSRVLEYFHRPDVSFLMPPDGLALPV